MDEEIFDEFGNVIGSKAGLEPNLEPTYTVDTTSSLAIEKPKDEEENELSNDMMQLVTHNKDDAIESSDINMTGVDILVETENTQSLNQPLIAPKKSRFNSKQYIKSIKRTMDISPPVIYDMEYMMNMCSIPERIRNVAIIGPTNSGKTSLVDLFVMDSHNSHLVLLIQFYKVGNN